MQTKYIASMPSGLNNCTKKNEKTQQLIVSFQKLALSCGRVVWPSRTAMTLTMHPMPRPPLGVAR